MNANPLETWHVEVNDGYLFEPSVVGRMAQILREIYGMKSSGMSGGSIYQIFRISTRVQTVLCR